MQVERLETERLILRQWREGDWPAFAAMNADSRVMEHFPGLITREASDETARRLAARIEERGWGLWAVEVAGGAPFIGFVGLSVPRWDAHFTPCVEVGWRLAADHWGKGYASEAARAAVRFGFERVGLGEIVSFTVPGNWRSRRVMEGLGMTRDVAGDFEHPELAEGHRLRRHVLYRLKRASWESRPGVPERGRV